MHGQSLQNSASANNWEGGTAMQMNNLFSSVLDGCVNHVTTFLLS